MELFKLMGTIAIEGADKAKREIDEVNDSAGETSSKLSNTLGSIGNTALAIGKTVAVGVGVAGTAIVGITKQAVDAFGEYEQLVGGVETLYGDSAKTVLEYANNAYKTAGLSANAYMQTITSFTASLLQGLDGDTAKTAQVADMAIQDMADNANKMGISMEMIQNAYQGISKQNYTMLDNLKLGYGGTKGEMERLLAEAEKLPSALGRTFDINNLSDVYTAIHLIQEDLGITGTTAKEAGDTIQGSMSAVSASWQNVLIGLANENANLDELIQTLIDNLVAMLGNMLPTIETVFKKIPSLITGIAPLLGQLILDLAPSLLQSITTLITNLASSIPNVLGQFGNLFSQIINTIQTNIPVFVDKAREMMGQFGEKIKENLPTVISKALDMLLGFSQVVIENVPMLVAGGMDMIKNIVQGIINSLPTLIQKASQIIINFANTISASMTTIFAKGVEIIWNIIKGIIGAIPDLIANFPKVIEAIFAVWNAINWLNLGKNLINGIGNGIKNVAGTFKTNVKTTFENIVNTIRNVFTNGFGVLKSKVSTIFNSVKTAITSPITTAKNVIKGIVDAIKGFFKFKISIPKIALPHFSIKPSGWKLGDLLKGKIPSLGISWYAKAMDNPMVLDKPTIFGASNGKFLGAGEAGAEVVAGRDTLMGMIQNAVDTSNARNTEIMEKVLSLLATYIPQMAEQSPQLVLDTGVLVSQITPRIDMELGVISRMKERGR